jgi:hypothetical protein
MLHFFLEPRAPPGRANAEGVFTPQAPLFIVQNLPLNH